jgi:HAD superfamily hydrolase (TIGR01490 family)
MTRPQPGIAFFDVDNTILAINSGTAWMKFLYRRGEIGRRDLARAMVWAALYHVSMLDMHSLAVRLAERERGGSEARMREVCERWWQEEIRRHVTPRALAAIDRHRARGDKIALLTSGTQFLAEPMARDLGCDAALCSRLEVEGGVFTGRFADPFCFGHGKIAWAERYAAQVGRPVEASAFYSDSYNDLPMLERVAEPVVVNPDFRLARVARLRRWPVERWV